RGEPGRPGSPRRFRREGTLPRPQRLPRSPPGRKIRPGSGGFVAFLRARIGTRARIALLDPTRGALGSGRFGGGGLVEQVGDGALVDLAGHGDAADPVDAADAGVEDGRAAGGEGVGRALHPAAPAPPPLPYHVAA